MLLFNIADYKDFQYLYGMEEHSNGVRSRKNRIMLTHIKNRQLIDYCRRKDDYSLLRVRTMTDLKKLAFDKLQESGKNDTKLLHKVNLIGMTFYSSKYRTDEKNGLCDDLDGSSIRYISIERNREFKMRSGKFISKILRECELGQILSEQVINWLTEEFTSDWESFTKFHHPEIELHIDDNFRKIYNSEWCRDFKGNSCMMNTGHWVFYRDSVEAKAAYLTDKDGYVLARAIIYTNVTDQYGNRHRLLERQYCKESNPILAKMLIEACIKGGHITAYKTVGAACADSRNFVAVDGTSLTDLVFQTPMEVDYETTLSYQDSFKYLDYSNQIAYNVKEAVSDPCNLEYLDTTNLNLNGDCDDDDEGEWDEYHCEYVDSTVLCHRNGHEIYVDVERLEDFEMINGERHHVDDLVYCDHCGKAVLKADAIEEKGDDSVFCCEEHRKEYIEEHWYHSQWDEKYYPKEDDITTFSQWNDFTQSYRKLTINRQSLETLKINKAVFGFGENWFMAPGIFNNAEAA